MGPQPIAIEVRVSTPEDADREYPRLWSTIRRDFPRLDEQSRLRIVDLALGVCHACHDNETDCRCWDDE